MECASGRRAKIRAQDMKQLLLELAPLARPTFANFVTGSNRELVQILRQTAAGKFPDRMVYIWGEGGAGKSHLLEAMVHAAQIPFVVARSDAIPEAADGTLVALDNVQSLDESNQIQLFNLINVLRNAALVAAGPCAPRDLTLRRDLATRLGSGLVYQVHGLSDEEKRAALAVHAQARGFALNGDIVDYLLRHARRDMPSLIAILDALDRHSLQTGRPVTLPLLKDALQAQNGKPA
jgi:DnaA family protein